MRSGERFRVTAEYSDALADFSEVASSSGEGAKQEVRCESGIA